MGRYLRVWAVVLGMAAGLAAQTNEGARFTPWTQEVGFWGAYSPDSTVGIGKVLDRKFFELDGQYTVTILAGPRMALKAVAEVVPVALLNEPTEVIPKFKASDDARGGYDLCRRIHTAGIAGELLERTPGAAVLRRTWRDAVFYAAGAGAGFLAIQLYL